MRGLCHVETLQEKSWVTLHSIRLHNHKKLNTPWHDAASSLPLPLPLPLPSTIPSVTGTFLLLDARRFLAGWFGCILAFRFMLCFPPPILSKLQSQNSHILIAPSYSFDLLDLIFNILFLFLHSCDDVLDFFLRKKESVFFQRFESGDSMILHHHFLLRHWIRIYQFCWFFLN